ncbi:MAG: NifU family protein [Alphaproteobacteria bacterium]|nr:NifU family protein [Alphaproteobacteria bacterium]
MTTSHPLLQAIAQTNLCQSCLLTADFIIIAALDESKLPDLELITLAEISDYLSSAPQPQVAENDEMIIKIKKLLSTIIAPFLQHDGGDIEFVSYGDNRVYVHFLGKCQGCPYASRTLKEHVEKKLRHYLPHIQEVILT